MLSAYLFDQRQGESVEEWADALQGLSGDQLLWLDVLAWIHESAGQPA